MAEGRYNDAERHFTAAAAAAGRLGAHDPRLDQSPRNLAKSQAAQNGRARDAAPEQDPPAPMENQKS